MWDKRNKEPIEIKKFMVDLIMEKVIDEEDPTEYKKGINSITLDRLDLYAEWATKTLLDKIYFYDHFHPEILIKKGLFSDIGTDNVNEFYIPINIDITIDGKTYVDNLNWDILNVEMTPEKFAEIIVKDEKLKNSFVVPIAYQIRRGIHCYVYGLFKNIANNYDKYIDDENILLNDKQIKLTRNNGDSKKNIPTFLFDTKLSSLLGKKRKTKINFKNEDSLLPSFLKNKKEESNVVIDCKGSKNLSKSIKKIDKKKAKILNMIEHDKQSTTVEDNEYNNL